MGHKPSRSAPRLKVFAAQFGFYDSVVATPSRAAALRAWGVRQDLFAGGEARIAENASAVTAALAHPGVPLRRAVGSGAPFEVEPTSRPKAPKAPAKALARSKARPAPASPTPSRPPPDRKALDCAEAALRGLDERRKREETRLRDRQAALDAEREEARQAYVADRRSAAAAVETARRAFAKAGGET